MRIWPVLLAFATFAAAAAAPLRIACIGDSITEGAGLGSPSTESYPARLQRLLGATNEFLVRNFGVSGRTLLKKGDFPYWREAAFTNSRTFGPDIVIIQLGTNDSKPQNWRYSTNFLSDYKDLMAIYASLATSPQIFLCTPCPVFRNGAFDINPGIIATNIAPSVRALATELNLPVIDLHSRMTNPTWFPDTVHPDTRGMAAMASLMFQALRGLPANPPTLSILRPSPTRIILSWNADAGGLMAQGATTLNPPNWTNLNAVPFKTGAEIRQTNTLSSVASRYFRLVTP